MKIVIKLRKGKIRKRINSKRDNIKDIWRLYYKVISIQKHQINAKQPIRAWFKLIKEVDNNNFDIFLFKFD